MAEREGEAEEVRGGDSNPLAGGEKGFRWADSEQFGFVAVLPEIGADEGRSHGGEGPVILGFDFEEEYFHSRLEVRLGNPRDVDAHVYQVHRIAELGVY